MKIERKDFLHRVETIAPALATSDLVPILTHAWFTGDEIMAYNDHIALAAPCKTPYAAAVEGKLLLNVLRTGRSAEAEIVFAPDGLGLMVKCGNMRCTMATVPADGGIFDFPAPAKTVAMISPDFLAAIKAALKCTNDTSLRPEFWGITVIGHPDHVAIYATDGGTLVRFIVDDPWPQVRALIHASFWEQVIKIGATEIAIQPGHHAIATSDKARLFGRVIVDENVDYESIIAKFDSGDPGVLIPRQEWRNTLDRAVVVHVKNDEPHSALTISNGVATVITKSPRGYMTDELELDGHPDVALRFRADHMRRFDGDVSPFDYIAFTQRAVALRGPNATYLVGAKPPEK